MTVAQVVEKVFAATVLRVLEALRHHARVLQMPQVDVFGIVAGDEEIEQTITVVVKPDRSIRVDPGRQTRRLADARESVAMVVVEQFRPSPLDQEEVLIAVVVVVAPHRAHRHASSGLIHVRDAQLLRDVGEGAVVVIAVEMVQAADAAVRYIDVGPAIAVEVDDGDRCTHRGHFRHDAVEFVIEDRGLVDEVDARLVCDLLEAKTITGQRGPAINLRGDWPRLSVGEMADHPGRGQHTDEHDRDNDASDRGALHRDGGASCFR